MTAAEQQPTTRRARAAKASTDRATRFSGELFEAAQAISEVENRSARQQLEYWASVGRAVTAHTSASQSRVEAALAGTLPTEVLTDEEDVAFDATLDADMDRRLADINFAENHAARGTRAVYMDNRGGLVELAPDGSITPLDQ